MSLAKRRAVFAMIALIGFGGLVARMPFDCAPAEIEIINLGASPLVDMELITAQDHERVAWRGRMAAGERRIVPVPVQARLLDSDMYRAQLTLSWRRARDGRPGQSTHAFRASGPGAIVSFAIAEDRARAIRRGGDETWATPFAWPWFILGGTAECALTLGL